MRQKTEKIEYKSRRQTQETKKLTLIPRKMRKAQRSSLGSLQILRTAQRRSLGSPQTQEKHPKHTMVTKIKHFISLTGHAQKHKPYDSLSALE